VNATDIRKLPLPSNELLLAIGRSLPLEANLAVVDSIVDSVLGNWQPHHIAEAN
jgi:hypothetical protein